jgi:hypothetical protein
LFADSGVLVTKYLDAGSIMLLSISAEGGKFVRRDAAINIAIHSATLSFTLSDA